MSLRERYEQFIRDTRELEPHARHDLLMACIRSLLQTTALCLFDVAAQRCDDTVRDRELTDIAGEPWLDQDRQPIAVIRKLLWFVRNSRREPWTSCCEHLDNVLKHCDAWVEHRNEVSHGVPSVELIRGKIAFLERLARSLCDGAADVLPHGDGPPPRTQGGMLLRSLPDALLDQPVVFRRFASKASRPCVECSALSIDKNKPLLAYLVANAPIVTLRRPDFKYRTVLVTTGWSLRVRLPAAPVGFLFRKPELRRMQEWWCRPESQNIFLVYGEGGLGKTTLVLQFLHEMLSADKTSPYQPSLICFASAKGTRFGAGGYQKFDPDATKLDSIAMHVLEGIDEQRASRKPREELWLFVADTARKNQIEPRDVLIVIDNAETLTTKAEDAQRFAECVDGLTKNLGFRVIVTSRRDEPLPRVERIELRRFTMPEAVQFARLRASENGRVGTILTASTALEQAVEELGGNPLLIEALVQQVREKERDIASTTADLKRTGDSGLARFLYEDAWGRLDEAHRNLLFALVLVGPCSGDDVGYLCATFGTTHRRFQQDALIQARFVDWTRYPGGERDLALLEWAEAFLKDCFEKLSPEAQTRINKQRRDALEQIENEFGALPSRTHATREAFRARKERDAPAATRWFEEALKLDPRNHELACAFARFCIELGDPRRVLDSQLTELLEQGSEGSLLVARAAVWVPDISGEALQKHIKRAEDSGVDPVELRLLEAQHAMTQIEHRSHVAPPPPPLAKLSGESEEAWSKRQERAIDEKQRGHEEERDHLRRAVSSGLQQARDRLDVLRTREPWRDLEEWKQRAARLDARLAWLPEQAGAVEGMPSDP